MSAAAIESFEGLESGQHLALTSNGTTTKWTWDGASMVNVDGRAVEPWFFSGALREGRLVPANFAPPQVGEWFQHPARPRHHYLVVSISGEGHDTSPMVARFTNGEYVGFVQVPHIVDGYQRSDVPEWSNQAVKSLAVSAYAIHQQKEAMTRQAQQVRDAQNYLRYSRDYLNNAIASLERTTQ